MKGLFTQGVSVLFLEAPSLAQLRSLLGDYEIISENPLGTSQWQVESASMRIACQPEVNGVCLLDVVSRCWPDHLGSSDREPALHAAWSMGHFGPFASTGSLARAIDHAHRWEHAAQLAPQHHAFVRMRISYCNGVADGVTPQLPPQYDPLPELEWLIGLARHVCRHPRAVAYFNPNGEVLLPPHELERVLDEAAHSEAPPLDAMINVRLVHVDGWQMVDTVGLGQLDLTDQEIVCPEGISSPEELSSFAYDAAYHMVTTETPIVTDNSSVGPGGTEWLAEERVSSLREPVRPVVHWTEMEGPPEPEHFFMSALHPDDQAEYAWGEDELVQATQATGWEDVPAPTPPEPAPRPPVFERHVPLEREPGRRHHGCLWSLVAVLLMAVVVTVLIWPGLPAVNRTKAQQTGTGESEASWTSLAEVVLKEWQPNTDVDAKAQASPPRAYHTPLAEGRSGSTFIMRYGSSQVFCAASTLHQFDGRSPAALEGPFGLKALLDNVNVLKLRDVQVQQVTDVSRPFECLEYDPSFTLKPGDELLIPTGNGEAVKGRMADSVLLLDQFISRPGKSQDFAVKLDQPFDLKGFSGAPVIKAATGKVVGVLRSADDAHTMAGFETLSLGRLPAPPPAKP